MTGEEEEVDFEGTLDSLLSNLYDFGNDFHLSKVSICGSEQVYKVMPNEKEPENLLESKEHVPVLYSKKKSKETLSLFNSIKDELNEHPKCTGVFTSSVSQHVEVVKYVSHKKKLKSKKMKATDPKINFDPQEDENDKAFDFEKARLEVHKFGITGYKKEKQRKFEQERAVMLGAKPPKKEFLNYRVYQEKIKESKQAQKERNLKVNSLEPAKNKRKPGHKDRRFKKAKESYTILSNGKVGRFRDGAWILSTKDIQKIKQSKIIK